MKIYGASDDLIEIDDPHLSEEFDVSTKATTGVVLALSNGVLLRARYEDDGVWRFVVLAHASAVDTMLISAEKRGDNHYSDLVEVSDPMVQWVAIARNLRRRLR